MRTTSTILTVEVGSDSEVETQAVKVALSKMQVAGLIDQEFEVTSCNPKVVDRVSTFEETEKTAMIRAVKAKRYDSFPHIGIGIQTGVLRLNSPPYVESPDSTVMFLRDYMAMYFCCAFDGELYGRGMSPSFEIPKAVQDKMIHRGESLEEAYKAVGIDACSQARYGVVAEKTRAMYTRMGLVEDAVSMALLPLLRNDLYAKNA